MSSLRTYEVGNIKIVGSTCFGGGCPFEPNSGAAVSSHLAERIRKLGREEPEEMVRPLADELPAGVWPWHESVAHLQEVGGSESEALEPSWRHESSGTSKECAVPFFRIRLLSETQERTNLDKRVSGERPKNKEWGVRPLIRCRLARKSCNMDRKVGRKTKEGPRERRHAPVRSRRVRIRRLTAPVPR